MSAVGSRYQRIICVLHGIAVREIAIALELIAVLSCKGSIIVITNPNTVYTHPNKLRIRIYAILICISV
jgi:hypothetical protein